MDSSYITSATKPEQLPDFNLPEVALIGRSNAGKSSLLNALLNQRNLARASREPGRTQMVNFFKVNGRVIFADLPGYGYTKILTEMREGWPELIEAYLRRTTLKVILFLCDCRRDLDETDITVLKQMRKAAPVTVVLTKADKLSRDAGKKKISAISAQLANAKIQNTEVVIVSATKKSGIEELREALI